MEKNTNQSNTDIQKLQQIPTEVGVAENQTQLQSQCFQQRGGEPMLFIDIKEVMENDKIQTKFEVHQNAVQVLSSIRDKHVAVMVIAGPYRSGKSFLANRILNRMTGFDIGPTTNPCTKGIWLWSEPIPLDSETVLLLLDTEGLNSTCHIDEVALENMQLVVNLSENIVIDHKGEDDNAIAEFCPQFLWVLRDFSLDLKGKSEKQYLEEMLKEAQGKDPDTKRKNCIREKIKNYFRFRDCICLVRPIAEENKLAHIQDQSWESLRPQFKEGVEMFEKKVFNTIQPKMIRNKTLNGEMFLNLTYEYIQALNSGAVPEILPIFNIVVSSQARKIIEEIQQEYDSLLENELGNAKLPLDESDLQSKHSTIVNAMNRKLERQTRSLVDTEKIIQLKNQLNDRFQKGYLQKEKENNIQSQDACKQLLLRFFNAYKLPKLDTEEDVTKTTLIQEKLAEFNKFRGFYLANAKGPFKYRFLGDKMAAFLYQYFDEYVKRVVHVLTDENKSTKKALQHQVEQEALHFTRIATLEQMILELQMEKATILRTNENEVRRFEKSLKLKTCNEEYLAGQLDGTLKQLETKKHKITMMRQEMQELQQQMSNLKMQVNEKSIQNATMQKRLEEAERNQNSSSSINGAGGTSSAQLITIVSQLRQQIEYLEQQQKKKMNSSSDQSQAHLQELKELQQEKYDAVNAQMQKSSQKIQKIRTELENRIDELERQNQVLSRYNDELKSQHVSDQVKINQLDLKDVQLRQATEENSYFTQQVYVQQSNMQTQKEVIEKYIKDFEDFDQRAMDNDQKIAILMSETNNLKHFKDTILPFGITEMLKWTLNQKPNSFSNAFRNFSEEDKLEIQNCFAEVGIKLSFNI